MRERSLDPASDLPELMFAGAFLTAPGGYPSDRSWAAPGSWRELDSTEQAELAVAEQAAAGAQVIKVAINVEAGPVLTPPVLAAVVVAAHANGMPVVAHAQGANAVEQALGAGVDVLAHTPWTEELGPDLISACADQLVWISTLAIHGRDNPAHVAGMNNLYRFLSHGGRVRYGTDLGNGSLPLTINPEETLMLEQVGLNADDVMAP